jgi:hypothetical protein
MKASGMRSMIFAGAVVLALSAAVAQAPTVAAPAAGPAPVRILKSSGVWIEGPGATVIYGGTYADCAGRCVADTGCQMLEYYRPEKKCNLYREMRPRLKGGSSDVGIKQ